MKGRVEQAGSLFETKRGHTEDPGIEHISETQRMAAGCCRRGCIMTQPTWGLLGPEFLPSSRRARTLGVGASVRSFNDLAVPGLGGVWFGKQILLAVLGVHVATEAGARNIEVANAIEALACWLAFDRRRWAPDPRLRGNRKLQGHSNADLSFKAVRRPSFYVSQPMRMATVQTLPALGLVEPGSARFNAFACSQAGRDLIQAWTEGFRPHKRDLVDHLVLWVRGSDDRVASDALRGALSPTEPLPAPAVEILRDRLIRGGIGEHPDHRDRRRDALQWVESRRAGDQMAQSWANRPAEIRSDEHWSDLRAGALFFTARDAALAVLDALELRMPAERRMPLDRDLVNSVATPLGSLRQAAQTFLDMQHSDTQANTFCATCGIADPIRVLKNLVERDGQVLRLLGSQVCPGPAFRGSPVPEANEEADVDVETVSEGPGWPEGISQRVTNLFLLNLDLNGKLDEYLTRSHEAEQ